MNPDVIESEVDEDREHAGMVRDEYVMSHYFIDHPDDALREDVENGTTPMKRAYRILKETGGRDPKTGVARADLLKYSLEYELVQSREQSRPTTIGIIDIDNFKKINDTLGHDNGDVVLQHVADIITKGVGPSDDALLVQERREASNSVPVKRERRGGAVVRWGGEEFIVILSGDSLEEGHRIVEKIRANVEQTPVTLTTPSGPVTVKVTVSGGVAEYQPGSALDQKSLIKTADNQVLAAKAAGRNRVFPEPIDTEEPPQSGG